MQKTELQTCFFQDDKMFKKYFCHEKSQTEREETQKLIDMIKNFYRKVFGEKLEDLRKLGAYNRIGYVEGYGYYAMSDNDHGYYYLIRGNNIDEAFWLILEEVLLFYGDAYEWNNRKKLKEDFIERFGTSFCPSVSCGNYYELLYKAEFALKALDVYYDGNIPDYMIKHYENDLSKYSHYEWKYNCNTKKMELVDS